MKNTTGSTPVGVRVPKDIKRKFDEYCDRKGLKKSYLLSKIIGEKVAELEEDEMDLKLVEERMEEERITLEEFNNKYIDKRSYKNLLLLATTLSKAACYSQPPIITSLRKVIIL